MFFMGMSNRKKIKQMLVLVVHNINTVVCNIPYLINSYFVWSYICLLCLIMMGMLILKNNNLC